MKPRGKGLSSFIASWITKASRPLALVSDLLLCCCAVTLCCLFSSWGFVCWFIVVPFVVSSQPDYTDLIILFFMCRLLRTQTEEHIFSMCFPVIDPVLSDWVALGWVKDTIKGEYNLLKGEGAIY